MIMEEVLSGSVNAIGWEDGKMQVQYKDGSLYLYHDVPLEVHQQIRISSSVGKAVRQMVVHPGNKYEKVNGPVKRE